MVYDIGGLPRDLLKLPLATLTGVLKVVVVRPVTPQAGMAKPKEISVIALSTISMVMVLSCEVFPVQEPL